MIAKRFDITERRIRYDLNTAKFTPKKSSGQIPSLSSGQMDQ